MANINARHVLNSATNLMKIFDSGKMTDVTLVCDDKIEIKAHRAILSAGSTYFGKLFNSEIRDVLHLDRVKITGIRGDVLMIVVRYIYGGKYPTEFDNNVDLMTKISAAADFYTLPALSDFCRQKTVHRLMKDNNHDLLEYVKKYGVSDDKAVYYLSEHFDRFIHLKEFRELNVRQLKSVIKETRGKHDSQVIVKGLLSWANDDKERRAGHLLDLLGQIDWSVPLCNQQSQGIPAMNKVDDDPLYGRLEIRESYGKCHNCEPSLLTTISSSPNMKIDFYARRKDRNCCMQTYYTHDRAWSAVKQVPKVSIDWGCCWVKNYCYFVSYVDNKRTLIRIREDCSEHELIGTIPEQVTPIFKIIECQGKVYICRSQVLVCYDPDSGKWETFPIPIPQGIDLWDRFISTVGGSLVIILPDTNFVYNFNPELKRFVRNSLDLSAVKGFGGASCDGKIYFYKCGVKNGYVYDPKGNTMKTVPLPNGIGILKENWRLYSVGSEMGSLLFFDQFDHLWEFVAGQDKWRRIAYAQGINSDESPIKGITIR